MIRNQRQHAGFTCPGVVASHAPECWLLLSRNLQRRQQIVGDCLQLKTDVDVYNDKRDLAEPIQIPLDFTLDVAELQQPLRRAA